MRWDERTSVWLAKHFDRRKYNQRTVNALLRDYVLGGGQVKGQWNEKGREHPCWYSVNIEIEGVERFIKWVIEPEEDENPGLEIVSAHPPH
ncbi:MAG: hypothetical protein IBJ18_02010 [Phycisphaerales bacterium]|nr:hypothetical protein [Phycisphaerales bacterium]